MKTLNLGRKLCKWGLPLAMIITILEAWTYRNPIFVFCRLLFIVPAFVYLLFTMLPWSKDKMKLVLPLHIATIAGGLLMMVGLALSKLNLANFHPAYKVASVTGGLVTIMFVAYIFSAGAKKYVRYILILILSVLFLFTLLDRSLTWKEASLFINPAVTALAIIILSIYDEEQSYRSFRYRKELEWQQRKLQEEIQERKALEQRLQKQLHEDYLTGVYNRRVAFSLLDSYINTTQPFSLCYIDIDNFKKVNDRYGHSHGDTLLVAFAQFLKNNIRKSDYLCRIGGDEFLVILPGCHVSEAQSLIERIRHSFVETRMVNDINLDFSYGFSHYNLENINNSYALLEAADRNMYRNKTAKC